MNKLLLALFVFWASALHAQTYTQSQWGVDKTASPYGVGLNVNGAWTNIGTVSSLGVWAIPSTNISGLGTAATQNTGTSGHTLPFLDGVNTWAAAQTFSSGGTFSTTATFSVAPIITTLTGYMKGNGASALTASATIPNTDITGLGTSATVNTGTSGATIPLLNGVNTWSGVQTLSAALKLASFAIASLPTCNAASLGSIAVVSNGTDYATGTYGSAVSATGIVSRKVLCTNTAGATTYAWAYD